MFYYSVEKSEQEKGVTKGFRRDFGGLGDGEMEPLICLHIKSSRWNINLKLYYWHKI